MLSAQGIRNFFNPGMYTLIIFGFFSLIGIGFFLALAFSNPYSFMWAVTFIGIVYVLYPIWPIINFVMIDNSYLPVTALLIFPYLYLLSCVASYVFRWFKGVDSYSQPAHSQTR